MGSQDVGMGITQHRPRPPLKVAPTHFHKVRDELMNVIFKARLHGGITDFNSKAEELLNSAIKEYGEPPVSMEQRNRLEDKIGGALFDATEHAGEFAAHSDKAISSAVSLVSIDIAKDIEKTLEGSKSSNRRIPFCFPAGTLITMADESKKMIQEVVVGDLVRSCDVSTMNMVTGEVQELYSAKVSEYYVLNHILLSITGEHPLYTKKRDGKECWSVLNPGLKCPHGRLAVGDWLYSRGGVWIPVTRIQYTLDDKKVYNLKTVNPAHTFFAEGLLVHNGVKVC